MISMDASVEIWSLLQIECKDSVMLKRKLHYVSSANTNEGVTLCEFNDVYYKEMEIFDQTSVMQLPNY